MFLKTFKPSENLNSQIDSLIYFKDYSPDHSIERAIPDGKMYLIIELDNLERTIYHNETQEPLLTISEAWFSGMKSRYTSFSTHADMEMLVAVFHPWGACFLMQRPMSAFTDKILPANQIWGIQFQEIRTQIKNETVLEDKIMILQNWLLKKRNENLNPEYLIIEAISTIVKNSTIKLKLLVEKSRYSKKQFIQLFKKYTGVTPKLFQRIIRFNEILKIIEAGKMISWTQISGECGYFDQAHFIKDFKAFSGLNPSQFLLIHEKTERINFFPFD